jgi:hypothetical protein
VFGAAAGAGFAGTSTTLAPIAEEDQRHQSTFVKLTTRSQ